MKFSDFKLTAVPAAESCDPCRMPEILPSDEDSPDLEMVICLRQGWCPICHYRVNCEPDYKRMGVNKFQCEENTAHSWDVDYVNYKMVRD